MTILKIYEPKQLGAKPEREVFLQLRSEAPDEIVVVVVDENGEQLPLGYLVGISLGGVSRRKGVNSSFGFKLNSKGQLKLDE